MRLLFYSDEKEKSHAHVPCARLCSPRCEVRLLGELTTTAQNALGLLKNGLLSFLDKRLLLLVREATEAVEALALAVAVVEAAVGALGELGDGAQVGVAVGEYLSDSHGRASVRETGRVREVASVRAGGEADLEDELHAGLARLVRELDVDAREDLVRQALESILHARGRDGVGGGGRDGLGHVRGLDSGERVVALGRDARCAVRAAVAEVALAALDLLGVPQVVQEAVVHTRVINRRDGIGHSHGRAGGGACLAGARGADLVGARASAAVVVVAGELVDVLARPVAGAALRAGGAAAALALVAVKALALAGLAVAHALVRALGVVVSGVGAIGRVRPGERVRARAQRAVRALPVLEARALVVGTADAVAGAAVRAGRGGKANEREEDSGLHR